MKTFAAQVDEWVKKSQRRVDAVVMESASRVFNEASRQGPSKANPSGGEGGRMPVDTGFLRSSFQVSFSGMPTGPGRGEPGGKYPFSREYELVLQDFTPGKTIYGGWTATYSLKMEERYAFQRGAAQQWRAIVNDVVAEAKRRFR